MQKEKSFWQRFTCKKDSVGQKNCFVRFFTTLQMFAGNCRDSAGVFCNICRENPVIYTDFPCNPCNPVNITGFSLQILQKTPCRVPAIPCKYLLCICSKLLLTQTSWKTWQVKAHIFWEGQKILRNLHLTFVCMYCRQM